MKEVRPDQRGLLSITGSGEREAMVYDPRFNGWWQAHDGSWYPPFPQPEPNLGEVKSPIYRKAWFWVLMVVVVGMAGCVVTYSAEMGVNSHRRYAVVYTVNGSGVADITISQPISFFGSAGDTYQGVTTSLPWTYSETETGIALLSVTAIPVTGSSISCSISVNGKVIASESHDQQGSGAYCIGHS